MPAGTDNKERTPLTVLLIEDNASDAELEIAALRRNGFDVRHQLAQTREEVSTGLDGSPYDLVLADFNLPHFKGMEAVEILQQKGLDTPLILVTGALTSITAVECLKQGATDFVLKDDLSRLSPSVRRALSETRLKQERASAQAELAKKVEELARSNNELEQFAYISSHDLQEPLRMVAAYTQLLSDRYRGRLDENADKYIAYAVEGALRMQALINDLLAFSRVGRDGGEHKPTDCNAAVEEAVRNLTAAIRESGVIVTRNRLPFVNGNQVHLIQLFQNLIGNAIKFRKGTPPTVNISAELEEDRWQITVEDNGIGISPEHREQIFVIFQRLHTRDQYSGNGLGLAICKKIVEQHGGRIWVESGGEGGSIFRLTLPAVTADRTFGDRHEAFAAHSAG
jgi:signal transduction histidine kinase